MTSQLNPLFDQNYDSIDHNITACDVTNLLILEHQA